MKISLNNLTLKMREAFFIMLQNVLKILQGVAGALDRCSSMVVPALSRKENVNKCDTFQILG